MEDSAELFARREVGPSKRRRDSGSVYPLLAPRVLSALVPFFVRRYNSVFVSAG